MNFWKWALFYIYSGVALGGLCAAGWTNIVDSPSDDPDDREQCANSRSRMIETALRIGDEMSDAASSAIINGHNQSVANTAIEAYKNRIAIEQPVNERGA